MKFATFTTKGNKNPRYGFKKEDYIIDILYLSKFLQEKNNDDDGPSTRSPSSIWS